MNKSEENARLMPANRPIEKNIEKDDIRLMEPVEVKGLNVATASFFIVGQVAGGGTIVIADAIANTGWIGVIMLLLSALANTFVSIIMTRSYILLAEKDENYGKHVRDPYTNLIGKSLGKKTKMFSSVCLHAYVLSTITVYLLISADIASGIVHTFVEMSKSPNEFRLWILVFALIITPLTLFGSPKEFWGIALLAFSASVFSIVLIIVRLGLQHDLGHIVIENVPKRFVTWRTFFSGLGTILFAMAGVPFFPALIADMKVKKDFGKAVFIGYVYNSLIYFPIGIYGFVLLGDNVQANILTSLVQLSEPCLHCQILVYASQVLLGIHFILGYLLIFNPMAQEVEEFIGIPRYLSWQRFVVRSSLVLVTVLLAEGIPKFGVAISLAGGTLATILSYILPVLAYFKLGKNISLHMKVILFEVMGVSCIICAASLYTSALNIYEMYSTQA